MFGCRFLNLVLKFEVDDYSRCYFVSNPIQKTMRVKTKKYSLNND